MSFDYLKDKKYCISDEPELVERIIALCRPSERFIDRG